MRRPDSEICEGDTERVIIQLSEVDADNVETDLDGTGFTLSNILVTGNDDSIVVSTSKFDWSGSAALGRVYFEPTATDLRTAKSPYRMRVIIVDGEGDIRSYPDDQYGYVLKVNKR
jgi:hypothetical protein